MKRIVIEIQPNAEVRTQSGKSARTGRDYSINKQEGWFHNGIDPYPTKIAIALQKNATPFAPGLYEIDMAESVMVDRYGELTFGHLRLIPARKLEQAPPAKVG